MIVTQEILDNNILLYKYLKNADFDSLPMDVQEHLMTEFCYYDSWELLHEVIDLINSQGKEYNFSIFKTYVALSIEKDSKYFKDFHFAHSEYITSSQTGKIATFNLIVKCVVWVSKNEFS